MNSLWIDDSQMKKKERKEGRNKERKEERKEILYSYILLLNLPL